MGKSKVKRRNDDVLKGENKMISQKVKKILQQGFDTYQITKNMDDLDRAIELAKILEPNSFFKDKDDPNLKKRVFQNRPFSTHWSGTAIKN